MAKKKAKANDGEGSNKDSVTVSWKGQTRVFSFEVQGEDYMDNAKEFAQKHGGKIE